jgi:hypothetical protein
MTWDAWDYHGCHYLRLLGDVTEKLFENNNEIYETVLDKCSLDIVLKEIA